VNCHPGVLDVLALDVSMEKGNRDERVCGLMKVLPPRLVMKDQKLKRTLGQCWCRYMKAVRHAVKRRRLLASILFLPCCETHISNAKWAMQECDKSSVAVSSASSEKDEMMREVLEVRTGCGRFVLCEAPSNLHASAEQPRDLNSSLL